MQILDNEFAAISTRRTHKYNDDDNLYYSLWPSSWRNSRKSSVASLAIGLLCGYPLRWCSVEALYANPYSGQTVSVGKCPSTGHCFETVSFHNLPRTSPFRCRLCENVSDTYSSSRVRWVRSAISIMTSLQLHNLIDSCDDTAVDLPCFPALQTVVGVCGDWLRDTRFTATCHGSRSAIIQLWFGFDFTAIRRSFDYLSFLTRSQWQTHQWPLTRALMQQPHWLMYLFRPQCSSPRTGRRTKSRLIIDYGRSTTSLGKWTC